MRTITPMIHVPDVRETMEWYRSIGFSVTGTHECEPDGPLDWAALAFGDGAIMLSAGGTASNASRREFDLYIHVPDVDAIYEALRDKVDIVEPPYDAFHGNRELIIRDCNRFWITFAHAIRG